MNGTINRAKWYFVLTEGSYFVEEGVLVGFWYLFGMWVVLCYFCEGGSAEVER